ncbi:MAG: hypothetical protein IKF39_07440 [Oscillospiraceae bacterium]|nr:hypothetical protein [Oscillospiraceae bacterium]
MRKFNGKRAVLILSSLLVVLIGMIIVLRSGSTQAVLTESKEQTVEIEMSSLDVAILENGKETDTLYSDYTDKALDPGHPYDDTISVKNTGEYDEYVRVIVKKYWLDNNKKRLDLSPTYIHLAAAEGWIENAKEATAEQSVWYCKNYVPVGEESAPLFTSFYIDSEVFTNAAKSVTPTTTGNVTTVTYDYDDITFVVEIEAQAIQYSSADKAILSAWGVTNVTASGGTVTVG